MKKHSAVARKAKAPPKTGAKSHGAATPPQPPQSRTRLFHRVPVLRALFRGGEWSRPDTLTAIGLAVAIAAIVAPILVPVFQSSPNSSGPDLKVEKVEIALAPNINASVQPPGESPPQPEMETGSAIDITLRNSGEAPALIVDATFTFTRTIELKSCGGGAGAAVSTAEYDVKVPAAKPVMASSPLVLHRDMRFIVNPNSIDRFRIKVGPDQYSSVSWPWIYQFNLSLVEDNGQQLDLGPMSILGFNLQKNDIGLSWDPLKGLTQVEAVVTRQLPCITHNAAQLSRAMADPGLHSPELQMMYREAKRLTTNPPSCSQIPVAQRPDGCPAPGGKGSFFSDPSGVTICPDGIEVDAWHSCGQAEYVMKEFKDAKASRDVFMTFQTGGQLVPMRCLPAGRAEVCRSTDTTGLIVGFIP